MPRPRRLLAGIALVLSGSLAAVGCGTSGAPGGSDGEVTLEFWNNATTPAWAEYWEDVTTRFEAAHEGVTIEIVSMSNEDFDAKLQTAMNGGEGPEIFLQRGGGKLADMVEAGQVMDLSTLLSDEVRASVAEGTFATYTVDGAVYGMPTSFQPEGIFYSQDLFAQAGVTEVPTTMAELGVVVETLAAAGIEPIALGAKDAWPAAHWYYEFVLRRCSQATLTSSLEQMDFSDQCWLDAGQDLADLAATNPFNDGFLTTSAQQGAGSSAGLIANHGAAMELMGTWDVSVIASLTPDAQPLPDLGWFPFPSMTGGAGDPTAIMGGVDGYSCAADAPQVCADFLNFIMTEENQEAYVEAFDMLPTNRDAQDAVTAEPLIAAMEAGNAAAYSQVWLDTSLGANVGNALNVAVVDLLAGKGDAQGIVDAMTAAAAKE